MDLYGGLGNPSGEDRKTLFLQLAALLYSDVSPIDFLAQMTDVSGCL